LAVTPVLGWLLAKNTMGDIDISAPKAVGVFGTYAVVMGLTLDRYSGSTWRALMAASTARITIARAVLVSLATGTIVALAVAMVTRLVTGNAIEGATFYVAVGLFVALNGAYIAFHWAYRPSAIFGLDDIPEAIGNPIGWGLLSVFRALRRAFGRGTDR
jgi:hypothetical protein